MNLPRSADGLASALQALGVDWRFNLRAMHHEFRENGSWLQANDRTEARLQERIARSFTTGKKNARLIFGSDTWRRALNALLADREIDPFLAWLEGLRAWDGQQRLDGWLGEVFTVDPDCPLTEWAARFIFLGPVQRAFEPGAKMDEMPVLIGAQGCGKSTALRLALPPEPPEWFADGLHLAADPKARAEALQGRVIVEAAEMAGSTRAELESLKAFLSRPDDGAVRLAYRRNPETMLRRAIIVGTTNDEYCLPNDPSGNRRFVIVKVGSKPDRCDGGVPDLCPFLKDPEYPNQGQPCCVCGVEGGLVPSVADLRKFLDAKREHLWAEALWMYQHGLEARLPHELAQVQEATNEGARRRDDILEDAVDRWLAGSAPDRFTLAEAAVGVGLVAQDQAARLSFRDQRRLGAALAAAGRRKVRRRVGQKRQYFWETSRNGKEH